MLSLSVQPFHFGATPSVPAVEAVKNVGFQPALLNASARLGERKLQWGGVMGQLDGVQGELTKVQGGHRQELAVDTFSTVDSLGLVDKFAFGQGSGGFGGYLKNGKNIQATSDLTAEDMASEELSVLSGNIMLIVWQSVECLLAPLRKLLFSIVEKILGYRVG